MNPDRIRLAKIAAAIILGLAFGIQLIPYGRDHQNPDIVSEPAWQDKQTRERFMQVCGDCHSYQTEWPWYSNIAPMSWLVQYDVEEAREEFNVSNWNGQKQEGEEAAELYREGEMPPWFYVIAHPEARLSEREAREFLDGLVATFGDEEAHED